MNRFLQLSLLLNVLVTASSIAADASMCKSLCNAEKRQCRVNAKKLTGLDHPLLVNDQKANRDARALANIQSTPGQARADERTESQKRQQERDSACDSRAMACTRSCTLPAPAETTSDIMLKPVKQQ